MVTAAETDRSKNVHRIGEKKKMLLMSSVYFIGNF